MAAMATTSITLLLLLIITGISLAYAFNNGVPISPTFECVPKGPVTKDCNTVSFSFKFENEVHEYKLSRSLISKGREDNCYFNSDAGSNWAVMSACKSTKDDKVHFTGIVQLKQGKIIKGLQFDEKQKQHVVFDAHPNLRRPEPLAPPPWSKMDGSGESQGDEVRSGVLEPVRIYALLVADDAWLHYFGADPDIVRQGLHIILHLANGIYKEQNVIIEELGTVILKKDELLQATQKLPEHLDDFTHYTVKHNYRDKYKADVIFLFSGYFFSHDMFGIALGVAYADGLCQDETNTALVQASDNGQDRLPLPDIATTFAHELGHYFGFGHDQDNDQDCPCNSPVGACIMHPSSSMVMGWNTCQDKFLKNLANNKTAMDCLREHRKVRNFYDVHKRVIHAACLTVAVAVFFAAWATVCCSLFDKAQNWWYRRKIRGYRSPERTVRYEPKEKPKVSIA